MYAHDIQRAGGDWIDRPGELPDAARLAALCSLKNGVALAMTCGEKRFHAPQTLDECTALFAAHPQAVLLAGGTDVGLLVTKQLRELPHLIYLGNVAELKTIQETATEIEIGAGVALTDAMRVIIAHYPSLEELFLRFASPPIRNAGTLGGNIANGSPIGDSMPALLALDASLQLRSAAGTRRLPLNEFYLDYQKTALRQGELVEKVLIPVPLPGALVASYKVSKRFDQDISAVCGAYWLLLEGDSVRDVRLAYGGMAAVPKRALHGEAALRGKVWNEQSIAAAMRALGQDFTPISDMRASADYRREICANLLQRFFAATSGSEAVSVYRHGR
jgi:xanthine dehydrogenase small subunit